MAEEIYESRETVTQTPNGTVRQQAVTTDSSARPYALAERIIGIITGILLSLLAIRFLLSLLGANRNNGFADAIYSITYPFVAPFFGLFGYEVQYGVARFEIETVVAIIVYALVAYGITRLLSLGRVR